MRAKDYKKRMKRGNGGREKKSEGARDIKWKSDCSFVGGTIMGRSRFKNFLVRQQVRFLCVL